MKPWLFFLAGCFLGAALAGAWVGRYQVTSAGSAAFIHVYRLDRWTGNVTGDHIHAAIGSCELP